MYLNIPPERDCLDAPLLSMGSKRDKQQQSEHAEHKVAPGMQTILAKVATPQNHPVAVKSDRYIIHSVNFVRVWSMYRSHRSVEDI